MTNIAVSLAYAVTVAVSVLGETWSYYILGSVVEVILLAAVARAAWTWPRTSVAAATGTPVPAHAG